MAIFELEGPDGVYEVDAPDEARAVAAFKKMQVNPALDVAKSAGVGLAKGAISVPGLPGDLRTLAGAAADYLGVPAEAQSMMRTAASVNPMTRAFATGPSSQDIQGKVEEYTGEFYKPQTTAGEYVKTAGEFAPAILGGPASLARRAITQVAIPAVASETAGQATKGTAAEPWARAGAAVLSGGAAAVASRPKTASTTIRGAIPGNVTQQQLDQAEALFQEAARLGQPITRAEAIQSVTGGATRLGDVQRVVEGQGGMREFFAPRAAQNEAAFAGVARGIDPTPTPAPSNIGRAVGRAAEGTISDVRKTINAASDPFYKASAPVRLTPDEMARVRALPGYPEARDAVRNDPQLARYVKGLPEDSIGFLDEVRKYLNITAKNAAGPLNAQRNQQRSAGYGSDAKFIKETARNASQEYQVALDFQAGARERFLQPLLDGPIGRLAKSDTTTKSAISALFPQNPLPNSADEIATAVTALSKRNPVAARALVRAHAESVFNDATQNLIGGPNQFGGAKFAAAIRGNPQQAANLEAAVRALPNGDNIWTGFDRFLNIVEAQGTRQRQGSPTAFNTELLQDLRRGTTIQEAGNAVLTGGIKLPSKIKDTLDRWRLGRGVEEIASLLTNPEAGRRFAQIARMPTRSREATAIGLRLVFLAGQGARSGSSGQVNDGRNAPR